MLVIAILMLSVAGIIAVAFLVTGVVACVQRACPPRKRGRTFVPSREELLMAAQT